MKQPERDTPRLPLSIHFIKACRLRATQTNKHKQNARALARARHESGLSGEALIADTVRVLDSVRIDGRVPIEPWRQALLILLAEADDVLAERTASWVDDPSGDATWTGTDHGLRDN